MAAPRKWRWFNRLLGWYPGVPTGREHPAVMAARARAEAAAELRRAADTRNRAVLDELRAIRIEVARLRQLAEDGAE